MRIKQLKLHNWMGFKGDHVIDLGDKDVIGVIAEYVGDKEASNQGGKTSVIEAIQYALTGNSRAAKEVELIHYGQDVMWVELVLEQDDHSYTIRRGRDHKNNGVLNLDWIEKTPEAQAEIEKLVGFSKKDFELITYFKQAEITQFMDMSSAKKKEYIVQWFDLGHWEKLEKAVKEEIKDIKREHGETKAKIEVLEEQFDNDVDLDTELEVQAEALRVERKKIASLKKKIDIYQKKYQITEADCERAMDTIDEHTLRISNIKATVEKNKNYQKKIDSLKLELTAYEGTVADSTVKDIHKEIAQLEALEKGLSDKIKLAQEHKSGICPILNETCDRIKFSASDLKKWSRKGLDYREKIEKLEEELEVHDLVRITKDRITSFEKKIKHGDYEEQLAESEKTIEDNRKIVAKYDENSEKKLKKLKSLLEKAEFEKDEIQESVTSIKNKIDSKKKNQARIKKLKAKLKDIANDLDDKNYLAMMFGKNGIPSLEIENGFEEVEEEANFALQEMNPNMDITFKPTKELGTKEPICLACGFQYPKGYKKTDCSQCGTPRKNKTKDEIQFSVSQNGQDYAYYMDSGGGKSILALAMRIALTQLKRRLGGANLNVVFLDEPDSALDKRYLRNFVRLVTKTLTGKMGIAQIIWISHHKEIQNQVPHTLKVIKDGHCATTRWV